MSKSRNRRERSPRPRLRDLLIDVNAFLFPSQCILCRFHLPVRWALLVCHSCRRRLVPVEGPTCLICRAESRNEGFAAGRGCVDPEHEGFQVYAAVQMVDPADRIVHALKFHDRPEAGASMAVFMARRLRLEGAADWEAVVPMPLHSVRERSRGYNQSAEVAGPLARLLDARLEVKKLVRRRSTRAQADLDYGDRLKNVDGAFGLRKGRRAADTAGAAFAGRRCLLVDDVATTGHTLLAALRTLREAKPAQTAAVVFALA